MTKCEIIDDTAAYYSANTARRGTTANGATCMYYINNGEELPKVCAVGRYMVDPKQFEQSFSGIESLLIRHGEDILKPEVRGHDIIFWHQVQAFHDRKENWDANGLTEVGRLKLSSLKQQYCENEKTDN